MTEMPAKTPRPIGSTESFFPGRVKAAAGDVDADAAAAEAADWLAGAADGVGIVTAGEEVTSEAAAPAEVGAGTFDVPATTGAPVAAAEADADVDDADGAGTDDTPLTTIADAVSLEVAEADEADDAGVADTDDRPITTIPPDEDADADDDVAVVVDDEESVVEDEDETREDEAEAEVVAIVVAAVVEAVVEVDDDEPVALLEVVVEPDDVVEPVEFCIVTVHVFTSCTASFPWASFIGVSTTTHVSVNSPRGVFVV